MKEFAIEAKNLTKDFGRFRAVDNVSFYVNRGEIFGFLGANGAGKSTTIRMLCGLLNSSSGTAWVAGYDINQEPEQVKKHIGYMSQKFSLYEDLTVKENLNFFGGVYGLRNQELKKRIDWAMEMAGLLGREKILAKELAGGWKQRLALGCAILHRPKIVFLDEPTGGVDPIARRNFWELINNLSEQGTTVFVTTHYLDEAEYCNRIMLIHSGRIIAGGSPKELKEKYLENPILEIECERVMEAMEILRREELVRESTIWGAYLHLTVKDEETARVRIKQILEEKGIELKRIEKITPSLEDLFIYLIQKQEIKAER